jgi:phosphatidylglycerophosphatase C
MNGASTATDKKIIAAFDFDGTITKRDSMPAFIKFMSTIPGFLSGSFQMLPYLVLFKLNLIPNYQAKERLFNIFFTGLDQANFDTIASKFSAKIDDMINPEALQKIKWHQEMGHHVIIISASAENWIKPWALKNGIDEVLATKLEVIKDRLTGNLLTKNCHGQEKVNRLLNVYPERKNYTLYAYGDTSGDKELLALADHAFYRAF